MKQKKLPIAVLTISLVTVMPVYADDSEVSELKKEVLRLSQELEKSQKKLASLSAPAPAATTPNETPQAADGKQETKVAEQTSEKESSVLNEIQVHARKRSEVEKLKNVTKSISAVSGKELDTFSATNVTEILRRVGNVNWNYGNPRTGSFTLRGLSAGSNDTIDPSVGVVVDGVSYAYSPLSAGTEFFDMESVNVTRGPQGTAGHKNVSLGEITFTSKKPVFGTEVDASVVYGQLNTIKTQAVVNVPVIDGLLAWRGSFLRNQADGQYVNSYSDVRGRATYANTDRTQFKTQFLFTPTENFTGLLNLQFQPHGGENVNGLSFKNLEPVYYANGGLVNRSNLPEQKLIRPWFTSQKAYYVNNYFADPIYMDNNGAIITGTRGANLNLDWKISGHTVKYIGGYRDHYFSAANDEGTPFNITTDGGYITDYTQGSNELVLESDKGGLVDYKTGLYSFYSHNNSVNRTRYGSDAGAWFANAAQYNSLGGNSSGRDLLADSLNGVYKETLTKVENWSNAIFAEANWHVTEPLTVTTGLRLTDENRHSSQGIILDDYGRGGNLNLASINDVRLGGFNSNTTTGALLTNNTPQQLAIADTVAQKYFAKTYANLSAAERTQIANAKTLRSQQIGTLYQPAIAEPYRGILVNSNLTLSYKINDNFSPYVGWQHGSKAGIAQINGATVNGGLSVPVKPEISENFELGLKSTLFNKTLAVNLDLFMDNISNFQQSVAYYDVANTALINDGTQKYTTGTGNVPRVQVKGVELDANYSGIPYTNIRFAGAYNNAVYKDFPFSPLPSERANETVPYFNASGQTLARAPKLTGNLSVDYSHPVFDTGVFHSNFNLNLTSSQNYDLTLSQYGGIAPRYLADLSIGLGRKDRLFDANLIFKNLFNSQYVTTQNWNSFTPGTDRWIGIQLSSKL